VKGQRMNFREKFIAFHQSVVLLIGFMAINSSPMGSYTFFFPFAIALAPLIFVKFNKSNTLDDPDEETEKWRTYVLSSGIGILCAFFLMAMWFVWAMIQTFRELAMH
jgi:hypothetical protein